MLRVYRDEDADLTTLEGKRVAVIGYGNQGRAQGLNLRDSAIDVVVGSIRDASAERARADGFAVASIAETAAGADVVMLLIPDEVQRDVYDRELSQTLQGGNTLVFAHGYNVRFRLIKPPDDVDVVMLAPRMIGKVVRDLFVSGSGAVAYVGVHQDPSGNAMATALALAKGIGATRSAVIEQSFAEETELDLVMEQAVDSALHQVLVTAYEGLVEAGFAPEVVAMELYASRELAETMKEMAEVGFFEQMRLHSQTSQYGSLAYAESVLPTEHYRQQIRQRLSAVRSGEFAREWAEEERGGYKRFNQLRDAALAHPLNDTERRLRAMTADENAADT